ncbi:MAG: translation elongation factor Ts [Bacteroidales bacterium]
MANITAAEVNKLRQMTGAGMMDCKKALVENDGDFDKAVDYLRKKGQKVAANRAEREANEGMVLAQATADKTFACIVILSSETDFVAKNVEFTDFVRKISDLAVQNKAKSLDEVKALQIEGRSVADRITDMVGKIGEKIEMPHYEFLESPAVFAYNHHGNRLSTLVAFDQATTKEEVGHNVAMQIAAMNPISVSEKEIPQSVKDHEWEIACEAIRQEGKPENMVEKIAQGKLNKFYKENTLTQQEFIMESKQTVADYIKANGGGNVLAFRRIMLGA